jgi:TolB protein
VSLRWLAQHGVLFAFFALSRQPGIVAAQTPSTQPAISITPAEYEARWFRNVRQMTSAQMGLDRSGEAYFSRDGKRISFQAYPTGKSEYQIYVMNVDGTGLKMISTGQGATTCSFFHPSGEKMIFASNHLDQRPPKMPEKVEKVLKNIGARKYTWPFFPGMDVYEYTFATAKLRPIITGPDYDAECDYSPDGKSIVFCSNRGGNLDIYICDSQGQNLRRITTAEGYDGGPFFSPDGKRVIYRSNRRDIDSGTMQIFTNNLDGTDERPVTDHEMLHWCPYYHPSGKWIIYTRGDHTDPRHPIYDLYLVSDDGSQSYRVTADPAFDGLPVFSADGRYLMWTSKRNGLDSPQIFMAEFIGLTPAGELRAKVGDNVSIKDPD